MDSCSPSNIKEWEISFDGQEYHVSFGEYCKLLVQYSNEDIEVKINSIQGSLFTFQYNKYKYKYIHQNIYEELTKDVHLYTWSPKKSVSFVGSLISYIRNQEWNHVMILMTGTISFQMTPSLKSLKESRGKNHILSHIALTFELFSQSIGTTWL